MHIILVEKKLSYKAIGLDPGKTNGYVIMEVHPDSAKDTEFIKYGQFNNEEFNYWVNTVVDEFGYPELVVCEDYRVFNHKAKAHAGSKLETSKIIGKTEFFCEDHGIKLIKQPAQNLTVAQKWTEVKMPSNHDISHWVSAYNHLMFYLIKEGLALSAMEQKELKNEN